MFKIFYCGTCIFPGFVLLFFVLSLYCVFFLDLIHIKMLVLEQEQNDV